MLDDGIRTLAYGHFDITANVTEVDGTAGVEDIVMTATQAAALPQQGRKATADALKVPAGRDPKATMSRAAQRYESATDQLHADHAACSEQPKRMRIDDALHLQAYMSDED